jgi:adenylate cyclase class IV
LRLEFRYSVRGRAVPRNVELKARYPDLARAHSTARQLGAALDAVERHRDTYFRIARGRLKLRERWRLAGEAATFGDGARRAAEPISNQLIWYQRADQPSARGSDYALVEVPNGEQLRHLLAGALGVAAEVVKDRVVYLHDNVRIHLDDVSGLGSFIEFEAVVDHTCDDAAAQAKLGRLRSAFGVLPQQVVSQSYGDLTGARP